jgi:hypothetical protein
VLLVFRTAKGYARWYGFAASETNAAILPPLESLNAQADWLHTNFGDHPDADLIIKMVTDTCCNGGLPANHIVHLVLPHMPPGDGNKKDTFHGVQPVLDASGGTACGPINNLAAKDLGIAMGPFYTTGNSVAGKKYVRECDIGKPELGSVDRVLLYLMGKFGNYKGEKLNFAQAQMKFYKDKYWHSFVMRVRGTPEEHHARLLAWQKTYNKKAKPGCRQWWLPGVTIAFDNLIKHVLKGCFDYG